VEDVVIRKTWLLIFLQVLWPCAAAIAAERPVIYTINYPLQYFAQRIAGDQADVVLPVPPDVDPAFWQPDVAAIAAFQRADLILLNGAGYAKWLGKASLPRRKLVDTSAGFSDRYLAVQGGTSHSHGLEGKHSHAGTAFTTWLDFSQAVEQARTVRDALARLMPEQEMTFNENFLALERDLLDLDARLMAIVARSPGKPLLASHPVYQYLARRYSLNLKSVMWEPDALPPEAEWHAIAEQLQSHPAGWMLWEAAPAREIEERLQQLGVRVVIFDPGGNRPETGDFLSLMLNSVENLNRAFNQNNNLL
jgi:zinc transport system substrate-binding protein